MFIIMTVEILGCFALPEKTPSHAGVILRHSANLQGSQSLPKRASVTDQS
jgi:hypothetical protein